MYFRGMRNVSTAQVKRGLSREGRRFHKRLNRERHVLVYPFYQGEETIQNLKSSLSLAGGIGGGEIKDFLNQVLGRDTRDFSSSNSP
jgi:hypothetical protein